MDWDNSDYPINGEVVPLVSAFVLDFQETRSVGSTFEKLVNEEQLCACNLDTYIWLDDLIIDIANRNFPKQTPCVARAWTQRIDVDPYLI